MKSLTQIPTLSQPTSVALGLFDGLHCGHQQVISKAVAFDAKLTPVVFSFDYDDAACISKPDFQLLLSPSLKHSLLESWGVQYFVHPPFSSIRALSADDFLQTVLKDALHAQAVFCGYDYRFGKNAEGDTQRLQQFCQNHHIACQVLPALTDSHSPISSTRIRELIRSGDMAHASQLLGRPYTIDFPVTHGRQLGRRLGFPTINQLYPVGQLLPLFGVYAAAAVIDGITYPAVTNIGVKPTVGDYQPSAETYIIGYEGQLYGKQVPISLLQWIRSEKKFESVEVLQRQIEKDVAAAVQLVDESPWKGKLQ